MRESNQYFIATHNPYLFSSIAAKTDRNDLSVFIIYTEDHETLIQKVEYNDLREMLDFEYDPFLNTDKYLPE